MRKGILSGGAGLTIMIVFAVFLLLPSFLLNASMEAESYFIFVLWSVIGLFYFRYVSRRDTEKRFENAIHVWVALLSMIVFMSVIWMSKIYESTTLNVMLKMRNLYGSGADVTLKEFMTDPVMLEESAHFHGLILRVAFSVLALFALSLTAMLWNYLNLKRTTQETRQELGSTRILAYTDSLTQVKSKHAYEEMKGRIDREIKDEETEGFAVAICDLNDTKRINDNFGHQAGDKYIREGCSLICGIFKCSPVFRIGGDEFAVILEGADFDNRNDLLSDLNKRVEENIGTGKVVVSIGMADYLPGRDASFQSVFKRADGEMYRRKKELKKLGNRD